MTDQPAEHVVAGGAEDAPVVCPVPGGTIEDYIKASVPEGADYVVTAGGHQAWLTCSRGELQRWPIECTDEVDGSLIRGLVRRKGVWVINFQLDPAKTPCAPNCFNYVCSDPQYDIERLDKNARRDIRRGSRRFAVRRISWDELCEHGYPAQLDTTQRHGYSAPAPDHLRQFTERLRSSPCHEVWGAWQDKTLVAWMVFAKIDDYAIIYVVRSVSAFHRDCPNNALLYAVTRQLLVEEKRRFVSLGLSSVQTDPNRLSMHKYKVRMGYEALPRYRRFVVHPLLRPLIGMRASSWAWDVLASRMPHVERVRKLAGMARLLSGRETAPLAWAEEQEEHELSSKP